MENTHDVHFTKSWYKPWRIFTKAFWKKSRYIESDFQEDLGKIIEYYNEQGFRDARIVKDTVWNVPTEACTAGGQRIRKHAWRRITAAGGQSIPGRGCRRKWCIRKRMRIAARR